MHPHTKFGIPNSKNIGDMHRTQSGTDTRTDGRTVRLLYASQSSFGGIKRTKIRQHLRTEVIQTLYLYPARQTPKSKNSFDKVNCGTVNVACKGTSWNRIKISQHLGTEVIQTFYLKQRKQEELWDWYDKTVQQLIIWPLMRQTWILSFWQRETQTSLLSYRD